MSILSEYLSDLEALFFPPRCPVCGEPMPEGTRLVCTRCRMDAPLTGYWREADNPMARRLWGLMPVEHASALFYYGAESGWRRLVHRFKYRGAWRLARDAGRWYGAELSASGLYGDVDAVVPVPLHPFKLLRRGYNQSEYLAEGIAAELGVPLDVRSVVRVRNNPSQALTPRRERGRNVEGIFAVRRAERLAGCHVLLVDDVFTTGETLRSCGEAIRAAVPDCRLSIAALAVSRRGLGIDP